MMNKETNSNLDNMLFLLVENALDEKGIKYIETWLASETEAKKYYCDFIVDYVAMKHQVNSMIDTDQETFSAATELDPEMWSLLAEYEKVAPVIEVAKKQPPQQQRELLQKVVYPPRETRPIHKFNIIFLALNAAAILFLVLFLKFTPLQETIEVATVSDSINAKWGDAKSPMRRGTRLIARDNKLMLREGLVELTFDNHAKAIVEAPAEFQILAEDRIGMMYGKIYATVPPNAVGFSVYTPNAKVIDMGTEFGVQADFNGNTQLSVQKGKILLVAGKKDKSKMEITEGISKKIIGEAGGISDVKTNSDFFVRAINSEANIVWNGQKRLDLADIVMNGNGLGTGNSEIRLDYVKGFTTDLRGGQTLVTRDYLTIEDHPFIDGIFIPNGKTIVNSRGDVFEDFLWTDGVYCADLLGNPVPGLYTVNGQPYNIQFDGQEYSERGKSCIVMSNSNHGITFDLNAIRNQYKLKIDRFTSRIGLVEGENKRCNANFYVLVDGQLRYSLLGYTEKGVLNDVTIELEESDRFLTLATSENVDQVDYMANSTLRNNWCVFTEPVLEVE